MIEGWLSEENVPNYPKEEEKKKIEIENKEIKKLENYENCQDDNIWINFPSRKMPTKAETTLNIKNFRKEISRNESKMSNSEKRRAEKVINDLETGASAYQKEPALPPITVQNAKSAVEYGELLTDKIASWIKKGFVAGPFAYPPEPGFRANALAAVERNQKVRPILNMSSPKNKSFNDNIDKKQLEKIHMATAKSFSYGLRRAGQGAIFSKFDIRDAYKQIPAKPEDYRLQGFKWLGRYFCETRETFGSVASVSNFDRLSNTRDLVVSLATGVPRDNIFRVLDDTVCVSPKESGYTERFTKEMKRLSGFINLPLAKNCPRNEKAFECKTKGTVLGIEFDSETMKWHLPEEKSRKIVRRCLNALRKSHMDLKETQQLMGSVNDIAQLCPTLKFHKGSGNLFLAKFEGRENILLPIPEEMKKDLVVVSKIAISAETGLPIAEEWCKPTLSALVFYTDAAGVSFSMVEGNRVFHQQTNRGVSCIGGKNIEDMWVWSKITWPEKLLTEKRDEKGTLYGFKSTALESVGMLIPFLAFHEKIAGRNIVFKIDNMAVAHGWEKGYVKNDKTASSILRSVHYMAGYLGVKVYVDHVGRMSDEMASLADELSRREKPKDRYIDQRLDKVEKKIVESCLLKWLEEPEQEGVLCQVLLKELVMKNRA